MFVIVPFQPWHVLLRADEIIHEIYLTSHIRRRKYYHENVRHDDNIIFYKKRCSLLEYNEGSALSSWRILL